MLNDKITAVILAAGQGTRMKSSHPKVLHQILGRPMIAYLLDTLRDVGIKDILVVVGYQAEKVQEALTAMRSLYETRTLLEKQGFKAKLDILAMTASDSDLRDFAEEMLKTL